ncbi:MAG: ATP-binding cassette domain-containing protein [Actinobacteria bacterium]|uniref:Unannotated protein n=1 Tax=freshwater metagenome TaxID=449393 RepID=A0A6J5YLM2_9ZZZZ|nr:ATP-binding cassette domain-containing protein [Actinomycetota bacterium]
MLKVNRICSGYGDTQILEELSLDAKQGEITVVLGPNGHGKTTLLRTISGLLKTTSGEIEFDGTSISNEQPENIVSMGLTHIPQGDLLFPDMTVEENLLVGGFTLKNRASREKKLKAALEMFPQLGQRRSQRTRTLSGGERRMVALARGYMSDAKFIMIDEPSLGLAPVLVEEVYGYISTLTGTGVSVLIVEENFSHIKNFADMVYLVESGKVVASGPPAQVAADSAVMATYLGIQV